MSLFGTKIYTAHIKPGEPHAYEKPVFIKEGFNWWAFFFTFFWALSQRLWWPAIALFAVNMLVVGCDHAHALSSESAAILQLGIQLLAGFHANDWLRGRLKRLGYIMADISAGDSLLRAEQRYFERYLQYPVANA